MESKFEQFEKLIGEPVKSAKCAGKNVLYAANENEPLLEHWLNVNNVMVITAKSGNRYLVKSIESGGFTDDSEFVIIATYKDIQK